MPRPGLLLGYMYPLLILKYSLTRSRLMVWASSQYSSTNALSIVRIALSEAAVAIGPFGLVWDQPSRINAVNGEAEEGYLNHYIGSPSLWGFIISEVLRN